MVSPDLLNNNASRGAGAGMIERNRKKIKKRSGFLDLVNALLTLVVVAVLVCGGLFIYGVHAFYAAGPIKQDTDFVVEKGANLASVAEALEARGLIDNRYVFELGGLASHKHRALKAGDFRLTAYASMAKILEELTEGKPVQHGITIPEGFTMAQVVERLNADSELSGTLTDIPPEGGILPQTYNYEPGASRQSVLDEMVAAQKKALAEVWAHRAPNLPLASPEQLVTLASIVEKETGVPGERARVAAVFYNRMARHMRLQSDPTIIYGITLGKAALGRPLKKSEIEAVTPYNTYQVDGLPPTPIDNPGIDSLKAAANPADSKDLYFVAASTNPADGHVFAASYAEQRQNVAKLRKVQKQAAADAEAAAAEDQIEAQQAAAAGDTSVDPAADTQPAAAPVTPPPAAAAPATPPATSAPADGSTPAAASGDAPLPMPADARPASTDVPPPPAHPQPLRPRNAPQDAFGG